MRNIFQRVFLAMAMAWAFSAHAVVVHGGNTVTLNPSTQYGANYLLSVNQSPGPDYNGTGIWLSKTDAFFAFKSTLAPVTWNVDEEADFYLANSGDVLSAATLAQGQFAQLFTIDRPGTVEVPYPGTFYLAIVTGTGFDGIRPNRNVYGWAKFQNSYTGLTLLDSAMAYAEGGIVVGSLTALPVPEPSTLVQMALGLLMLGVCRHRLKHS